jgi:hypothetical protein
VGSTRTWDSPNETPFSPDVDEPLGAIVNVYYRFLDGSISTSPIHPSLGNPTSLWKDTPWDLGMGYGANADHATNNLSYIEPADGALLQYTYVSVIFEIIFTGGAHDTDFILDFPNAAASQASVRVPNAAGTGVTTSTNFNAANLRQTMVGHRGEMKGYVSTAMTSHGSLIATWGERFAYAGSNFNINGAFYAQSPNALFTGYNGLSVYENSVDILRYRTFVESTDGAGPLLTDLTLPNGQRMLFAAGQTWVVLAPDSHASYLNAMSV